ncbi:uncharacterized protein DFL_003458 [Arthrobotrys flagrans]|uniref:Uncharacterized protein n=1 Tax=Arthrobotrys flagrans TaxID=97331 RepID=A0A437A1Y0_ARTFL|nr:hypothetical protein DFL_003458 [Arthrobotrys flagrans]
MRGLKCPTSLTRASCYTATAILKIITGLLQNGLNLTELVFLRYNSTAKEAYPAESADIVDTVQEVRHAYENELLTSDITGSGTGTGTNSFTNTGTGTGTRTKTATRTGTGTITTGTDETAQISNIITSNNLQQYCTKLLSYFSPTWPITIITHSVYSASTSFIPEFTSATTTYTKHLRTRHKYRIRRRICNHHSHPQTQKREAYKSYQGDSISAACADAVTSPTLYIYDCTTISTYTPLTTTIDTTLTNTKSDIFTTTAGDLAIETVPATGNYYGSYVNYISASIPIKVNAAAAENQEGMSQIMYGGFAQPEIIWYFATGGFLMSGLRQLEQRVQRHLRRIVFWTIGCITTVITKLG